MKASTMLKALFMIAQIAAIPQTRADGWTNMNGGFIVESFMDKTGTAAQNFTISGTSNVTMPKDGFASTYVSGNASSGGELKTGTLQFGTSWGGFTKGNVTKTDGFSQSVSSAASYGIGNGTGTFNTNAFSEFGGQFFVGKVPPPPAPPAEQPATTGQ